MYIADRNFKGPFYTLRHVRYRLKRDTRVLERGLGSVGGNFPIDTFSQGPLFLMGASLGWWSADERYQVSGWVRNLTDEAYLTQTFDLSGPAIKLSLKCMEILAPTGLPWASISTDPGA